MHFIIINFFNEDEKSIAVECDIMNVKSLLVLLIYHRPGIEILDADSVAYTDPRYADTTVGNRIDIFKTYGINI